MASFKFVFHLVLLGLFQIAELRQSRVFPKPQPDGRIVGGCEVPNIENIPYQVSLQLNGRHFCGGSLISRNWVLTAAHCTDGMEARRLKVRAGSLENAKGGVVIEVDEIRQHPQFALATIDYDFSLLKLKSWSSEGVIYGAAKLPSQGEDILDGTLLTASGWGTTQSASEPNNILRAVQVPKFNQNQCTQVYKKFGGITSRMICAGYWQGGKDSCQGDSGGPLSRNGTLYGVVSWGYGCARTGYPGVYSRVASVRNWIASTSNA